MEPTHVCIQCGWRGQKTEHCPVCLPRYGYERTVEPIRRDETPTPVLPSDK